MSQPKPDGNAQRMGVSLTVSPIRDAAGMSVGASKVARINSGRISLTREPLDLDDVLSMAIESCGPALEAGFHHHLVKPVALETLDELFANLPRK